MANRAYYGFVLRAGTWSVFRVAAGRPGLVANGSAVWTARSFKDADALCGRANRLLGRIDGTYRRYFPKAEGAAS